MINNVLGFRCPCCNEMLDEYEIRMYEHFEGMKEECYKISMETAYEYVDLTKLDKLSQENKNG